MLYVSAFLFYVGFDLGMFLLCYSFVFVLFLVLLSDYEKHCFLAILVFLWVMLVQGGLNLMVYVFFFFLVLFVSSLNNEVVLLYVCVVCFFVTRLGGFLVCILWSCFFLCCFVVKFSFLSKRQKKRHCKIKTCRKKGQLFLHLAQLCSQIVLLIWGVGLKILKTLSNSGLSIFWEKKCQIWQNVKFLESKVGPSMLRNIIGPVFDSGILTFFWRVLKLALRICSFVLNVILWKPFT